MSADDGGNTFDAGYYVPHLAHATMEPPVALAEFRDGKVRVWAPTQNPQSVQEIIAHEVGVRKEDVTCHVTLLGGGFGRKSFNDFAAEAAVLSKKLGRPVKVVWSREDDIKFDYYLPVAAIYMKATLDAKGKPTAWLQRSASPPINSTFDSAARYGGWELKGNWIEVPFDVPNLRVEGWKPLFDDDDHAECLVPMLMLCYEHDDHPALRPKPIGRNEREKAIAGMAAGVTFAYRYFPDPRRSGAGLQATP